MAGGVDDDVIGRLPLVHVRGTSQCPCRTERDALVVYTPFIPA